MTEWVTGFVIPDVAAVHAQFARNIELLVRAESLLRGTPLGRAASASLGEYRRALLDFNAGLGAAAQAGAIRAQQDIIARLNATQVRTDTDASPHLRDLIRCAPLNVAAVETGVVGIGDVARLDLAVNPRGPGYGPYWTAQEYGTGRGEVKSQVGRILFGYFAAAGGGDLTPPQAQYAGGGGPHPIFQSSGSGTFSGPLGGRGGLGTIGVEIRPRHFIEQGKDAAAVAWRNEIDAVQQRAIDRIAAIGPL